ncbi:hypothetical protein TNCT_542981 [Trichonephila clavata]|uniref:Uncharacterized protein n=1 Tax=Trichonephila clavata TaxID=2740835 RepID=A0A8X6K114_TRICU|nr:hypothetical protein TNCT_542981 [Trichonephila clavata]
MLTSLPKQQFFYSTCVHYSINPNTMKAFLQNLQNPQDKFMSAAFDNLSPLPPELVQTFTISHGKRPGANHHRINADATANGAFSKLKA